MLLLFVYFVINQLAIGDDHVNSLTHQNTHFTRTHIDLLFNQGNNSTLANVTAEDEVVKNECLSGEHSCDERYEVCVDLQDGYECRCKPNHISDGTRCRPFCSQGCIHGTCVAPDVCQCHFGKFCLEIQPKIYHLTIVVGYIGTNCSVACECNGHSQCSGIHRLRECLSCQNNTQGSQCEKCKPFYVGNPVNGGKCISCKAYCNYNSDICLTPKMLNHSQSSYWNEDSSMESLAEIWQQDHVVEAICVNCQHNSYGPRCEQCLPGYFKTGDNIGDGCRPCHCHGHGDMCNPLNGENCNCQNNTESDRQCNQKNRDSLSTPCWQLQCSKCKEYFLGLPTNGHQCYRHMFLGKDYCLDPNTQEECNRKPDSLMWGRTVFFGKLTSKYL